MAWLSDREIAKRAVFREVMGFADLTDALHGYEEVLVTHWGVEGTTKLVWREPDVAALVSLMRESGWVGGVLVSGGGPEVSLEVYEKGVHAVLFRCEVGQRTCQMTFVR